MGELIRQHKEDDVKRYRERLASDLSRRNSDLLMEYDAYMRRRGLTNDTRYTHLKVVHDFLSYLEERGVDVESMRPRDVRRWMNSVASSCAVSTTSRKYMVIKGFLRFLMSEEEVELEECYQAIRRPRLKRVLPDVLSEPEVIDIVSRIGSLKGKALFAILYETGARRSEILGVRMGDVELGDEVSYITIRSSKSEPRRIPVILFNGLLHMYIRSHPASGDKSAYLFHSPSSPRKPMSPSSVGMFFLRLSRRIGRRVHAHMLRHSRATWLLRRGMPEKELMYLLGERTRDMIDVYVTLTGRDVEEKVKKMYGLKAAEELDLVRCPSCGQPIPVGSPICPRCGRSLHDKDSGGRKEEGG